MIVCSKDRKYGELEDKTRDLLSESEEVMNAIMGQCGFDLLRGFENATVEEIILTQKAMKLYSHTKELAILQAKTIDETYKRIDDLVDANDKMSRELDEIRSVLIDMKDILINIEKVNNNV